MPSTDHSLRAGFLRQVALRPDAPALVVENRVSSYGRLDETARRWAGAIVERLDRPAERVGVFGSRSEISYSATLAALCSGAAFVPLNPRFPPERTRAMIRQAELDALIVDGLASTQLAATLQGLDRAPIVFLPGNETGDLECARPLHGELPPLPPDRLAYLLFTSGSTGTPKGVPILHSNVRAFINWAMEHYQFGPDDRFSQAFDQTFDLSIFDLFVAWQAGACVYAMSPVDLLAPSRFINKNELTVWFSVPSVPAQMRKRDLLGPHTLPTLQWSLFCGEPLSRASAEAWQAAAPNSVVENLYGPTELTIACTVHRWDPRVSPALCACANDVVPIGRPFRALTAVAVDEDLEPVADGDPGELCVCGPQTSPGYWNDSARSAERFVQIPGSGMPDAFFYRTGDQVRQLQNGEYVWLARTDRQIKVLGFRVELGEIEGVLQNVTGVVHAVALGWPINEGTAKGIVAFVSGTRIDVGKLQDACKSTLVTYMMPNRFIVLEEMPLNSNGKIDRLILEAQLEGGLESDSVSNPVSNEESAAL
ncbi:MAG TPA: amino acid adenylation domain-containing protein [Terriglobales bacterium]|nr:amino acid adenylation domain-containing protein [Terriglobales bacterium]